MPRPDTEDPPTLKIRLIPIGYWIVEENETNVKKLEYTESSTIFGR
jgi:hypothetical protein